MWNALAEYFLLRRAESAGAALGPDALRRGRAHLLLARQKAFAADTLWNHEQRAEALALLRDALDESVAAAKVAHGAAWAEALKSTGEPAADVDAAASLHAELRGEELPRFDAQVAPAFEARREELAYALEALDRALAPTLSSQDDLRSLRQARVGFLAVVLVATAAVGLRARLGMRPAAVASAFLSTPPGFPPAKAVDNDPVTEWILPLGAPGWIDVHLDRPRSIRAVRLLNAHNRTHNDLATRDYRVEAFAGGRLVGAAQGMFSGISPAGTWARHPIAASGVTRVRVWVDTFHGAAGGLGEIVVE